MAAPTAVTLRDISQEALKKAGYGNPVSEQAALVTRAEDLWMREIKNDIFTAAKKLTSLQSTATVNLVQGTNTYDLPTDFSSLMDMTLITGTSQDPLHEAPVWDYDKVEIPSTQGKPNYYFPIGDSDDGQFIIYPTPDATTRTIRIRYYADLTRLDTAGTLMSTLYRRWQNVWAKGLYFKALEHIDDQGAESAKVDYNQKIQELTMREAYGLDLSNIRIRIQEDE
jgi:hypothetical protein